MSFSPHLSSLACNCHSLLMSPSLLSQQLSLFFNTAGGFISQLLSRSRELIASPVQLLLVLSHPCKVVCCLRFPLLPAGLLLLSEAFSSL